MHYKLLIAMLSELGPYSIIFRRFVKSCSNLCPRIPPEDVVDTNGAGDAFVGGFLAAVLMNTSKEDPGRHPWLKRFLVVAGCRVVLRPGMCKIVMVHLGA